MLKTPLVSSLGVVASTILIVSLICGCAKSRLQTLEAGDDREVVIYEDTTWEVSIPLSYEVHDGGKVVLPAAYFYYGAPDSIPEFVIVVTDKVVGIAEKKKPKVLVAIHDFASGESWPYQGPNEGTDDMESKRYRLLKALNEAHPSGGYTSKRM